MRRADRGQPLTLVLEAQLQAQPLRRLNKGITRRLVVNFFGLEAQSQTPLAKLNRAQTVHGVGAQGLRQTHQQGQKIIGAALAVARPQVVEFFLALNNRIHHHGHIREGLTKTPLNLLLERDFFLIQLAPVQVQAKQPDQQRRSRDAQWHDASVASRYPQPSATRPCRSAME